MAEANFSKEELDILCLCVASYTDKYGDTYYPDLMKKLRKMQEPDRMTQKQIDYYNLLEKVNGRA